MMSERYWYSLWHDIR